MPPRWNNGSSTWHILHICFSRTIHNAFTVLCLINFHFISWSQIFLLSPYYCLYKNKHSLQTIFLSKRNDVTAIWIDYLKKYSKSFYNVTLLLEVLSWINMFMLKGNHLFFLDISVKGKGKFVYLIILIVTTRCIVQIK